jgi:hypothetical protein
MERGKTKKIVFLNSLRHFPLSTMHKAIGEVILQIFFLKQLSFAKKAGREAIYQKNSFNGEAKLC